MLKINKKKKEKQAETVIQHCLTFTRGNQDSCIATEALHSEAFGVQVICSTLPLCEVADSFQFQSALL